MVVEFNFKTTLSGLSVEEQLAFARRHRLSHDESERFFRTFQQPLPPVIYGAPPAYSQRKRRQTLLRKIGNDLRNSAKGSRRAAATMTNQLDATPPVRDLCGREQEHPLASLLPELENVTVILERLVAQVDEQRAQWSYPEPRDRRRTSEDRDRVVGELLRFWARCDRPLTYTTDDASMTRSGSLIDFLQDALKLLTDPPAALHPETLAQTIKERRDLILFFLKRDAEYAALAGEGIDPSD